MGGVQADIAVIQAGLIMTTGRVAAAADEWEAFKSKYILSVESLAWLTNWI